MPSFYLGNFKIFKNALQQLIPNRLPKHVITSTNTISIWLKSFLNYFASKMILQNIMKLLEIISKNIFEIMILANNLVLICRF